VLSVFVEIGMNKSDSTVALGRDGDRLVAGEAHVRPGVVEHPQQGAQNVQGGAAQGTTS
jgi:hypothetical protein